MPPQTNNKHVLEKGPPLTTAEYSALFTHKEFSLLTLSSALKHRLISQEEAALITLQISSSLGMWSVPFIW